MDMHNKVAIVTGGIRGIGYTTVKHFLRRDAKFVAIFDLDKENNDEVVTALKELEQEFDKIKFGYYCCDVVDTKRFADCFDEVSRTYQAVDILVNNAGVNSEFDLDLTIGVNFTSVVHCTMHAIERMGIHKGGKGGVVVNIASICAAINVPTIPVYSATKNAVVAFVKSMKEYNEMLGVRIVCLCPGMTKTRMIEIPDNPKELVLEFVSEQLINYHLSMPQQDANSVASATVQLVETGKEGDIWIVYNDNPPIALGYNKKFEFSM